MSEPVIGQSPVQSLSSETRRTSSKSWLACNNCGGLLMLYQLGTLYLGPVQKGVGIQEHLGIRGHRHVSEVTHWLLSPTTQKKIVTCPIEEYPLGLLITFKNDAPHTSGACTNGYSVWVSLQENVKVLQQRLHIFVPYPLHWVKHPLMTAAEWQQVNAFTL